MALLPFSIYSGVDPFAIVTDLDDPKKPET